MRDISIITGISRQTLKKRLKRGTALDKPIRQNSKQMFRGKERSLTEISSILGVHSTTIRRRIGRGMPLGGKMALEFTGNRERDLRMIVAEMHRQVIGQHQAGMSA